MARVPITVMGYRCERCDYEWIPRDPEQESRVCPKCKSPYWNKPRRAPAATTYEDFRDRIRAILRKAEGSLTWTEIRTEARLRQAFPNNQWVRRLEMEIGLRRKREHGVIHWRLDDP
jgi:DNA-directed RNA polymerase subunit RPC12/RpoP